MRIKQSRIARVIAISLAFLLPGTAIADVVEVPFGTRVFIELDQQVTSKRKHNRPGSFVRAHVWRDLVVNGRTVAEAGTPAMVQIGEIKPAKVAGIKGRVELKALQIPAIDGTDLMLTGGYDQSGKNLTALSVSLAVVVFVPLIFIKGKQAKLPPGTVFDAMVAQKTTIEVPDSRTKPVKIAMGSPVEVSVLYEILEQQGQKKVKSLPLFIEKEDSEIRTAKVTHVNEIEIKPIILDISENSKVGDHTFTATASVDLKTLGKTFTRGFNQFTVEVDGETDDVMLDIEL